VSDGASYPTYSDIKKLIGNGINSCIVSARFLSGHKKATPMCGFFVSEWQSIVIAQTHMAQDQI